VTVRRVKIRIDHTFDLDIPDDLMDEDGWDLDYFVYDAFENEDWEFSDMVIRVRPPGLLLLLLSVWQLRNRGSSNLFLLIN